MKVVVFFCAVAVAFASKKPYVQTCDEKPDGGMCLAYFPMFYFDPETGTCKEFIYGGCQGNGNRYATKEDCMEKCSGRQASIGQLDCDKDAETGECRAYIPRFYYDKNTKTCKKFVYGGCGGNRNNFATETDCYNRCGALSVSSVCEEKMSSGPCFGYFPRFYYNKETGQCEKFIYGGCRKNGNNFETQEECETTCKVPSTECDGKNEVYSTCGTACPLTCENVHKQPMICPAVCVSGCFCKAGLIRDSDGQCVPPEEC